MLEQIYSEGIESDEMKKRHSPNGVRWMPFFSQIKTICEMEIYVQKAVLYYFTPEFALDEHYNYVFSVEFCQDYMNFL